VEIGESRFGNVLVLRPVGRLDNLTSPEFQARLLQLATGAQADVIIDLAAVEYMSSGGLRSLVMAARQKPANHRIAVVGLHALVQEIFSIAHIEEVVPVFATLDEARLALAEPSRSDGQAG
jgi:anti-anti-sigma factor